MGDDWCLWRVSVPLLCKAVLERRVPCDVWCEGPCLLPWRPGVAVLCRRARAAYPRWEDLGGVQDDTRRKGSFCRFLWLWLRVEDVWVWTQQLPCSLRSAK